MRKGQATSLLQVIAGLLIVGLAIMLYFIAIGRYLDIRAFVAANEVERHTINLGQVLLSSDMIAYKDENKIHRGILEKQKLDKYFAADTGKLFSDNDLTRNFSYPNSVIEIAIFDMEDLNNKWLLLYNGKITVTGFELGKYQVCMANTGIFSDIISFSPSKLLDLWDKVSCAKDVEGKIGIATKIFPVAISVSDGSVHVGRMLVKVMEL